MTEVIRLPMNTTSYITQDLGQALRGEVISGIHSGHVTSVIISDIKLMLSSVILLGNECLQERK